MLMQSPTHAFLLKPLSLPFQEAWQNEEFTYTFIRDRFIKPAEMFIERMLLNDNMIEFMMQQLAEKVPENFQPRFRSLVNKLQGPLTPIFFRESLVDLLASDRGLRFDHRPILSSDEIDSYLYAQLPLFPHDELRDRLSKIFSVLPEISAKKDRLLSLFDQIPLARGQLMGAQQLRNSCMALLCLSELNTSASHNYYQLISTAMQEMGFAMPMPLIFADTNWAKEEFGFVVNPGSGKLELWRLDYAGTEGYPMTPWKLWVNGSRPDGKWGVYIKPFEYGQV